jgi:Flp pilus assembly protein TadG
MTKRLRPIRIYVDKCRWLAGCDTKRPGQALVELAISLTLLTLLLGAAIDLGLAFKTYQTLTNATAEASTYLSLEPLVNCGSTTCDQKGPVDTEARKRFRTEQGTAIRGIASTLDLDADGNNDESEYGPTWIASKIRIAEASSNQITIGTSGFTLNSPFNPNDTLPKCKNRLRYGDDGKQCFIVVQSEIVYKPFLIKPIVGPQMRIGAISVKPIAGNP